MKQLAVQMTTCLGIAALAASDVSAQGVRQCGPREAVIARLADRFGETRQSIGLGTNNALVEVFASEATGSWTITVTMANGVTCLVATGNAFERVTQLTPSGEPA